VSARCALFEDNLKAKRDPDSSKEPVLPAVHRDISKVRAGLRDGRVVHLLLAILGVGSNARCKSGQKVANFHKNVQIGISRGPRDSVTCDTLIDDRCHHSALSL
jgi:hypothetical protein